MGPDIARITGHRAALGGQRDCFELLAPGQGLALHRHQAWLPGIVATIRPRTTSSRSLAAIRRHDHGQADAIGELALPPGDQPELTAAEGLAFDAEATHTGRLEVVWPFDDPRQAQQPFVEVVECSSFVGTNGLRFTPAAEHVVLPTRPGPRSPAGGRWHRPGSSAGINAQNDVEPRLAGDPLLSNDCDLTRAVIRQKPNRASSRHAVTIRYHNR
jgi:hypothetical protein